VSAESALNCAREELVNLHEYQAKALLERQGIPIPREQVVSSPPEARLAAERIGGTTVVKAQVLTGGRGKAGGVKLAQTPTEAEEAARRILGMDIKGNLVREVLVAEAARIRTELYLAAIVDRASHAVVLMGSAAGGMDIEEVAQTTPEKIIRAIVDPAIGLADYQARELAFGMGLEPGLVREFVAIAHGLYRALIENDASLVEINPLVVEDDGHLRALDAKISIDDNAFYRQNGLEGLRDTAAEDPYEARARVEGITYVKLDGTIGCMVNGAGLAMATMDVVKHYGGEPANFLDIGGGARAERVAAALGIILSDPKVRGVLFNIFGGITRCDEVARGILTALAEVHATVPIVVRLVGTNEEEGRRILQEANIEATTSMNEAAQRIVALQSSSAT
jgi:succinyl-CoA synthetase beta subunit